MMMHLHPPTSSCPAPRERVRAGWRLEPFFGSTICQLGSLVCLSLKSKDAWGCMDVPSSARIEYERTEMWITVGLVGAVAIGRLFAAPSKSANDVCRRHTTHTMRAREKIRNTHTYSSKWCRPAICAQHGGSGDMTAKVVESVLSSLYRLVSLFFCGLAIGEMRRTGRPH